MDATNARDIATRIMGDPALMLQEQVQEELKIGEQTIQFAGSGLDLGRADERDSI